MAQYSEIVLQHQIFFGKYLIQKSGKNQQAVCLLCVEISAAWVGGNALPFFAFICWEEGQLGANHGADRKDRALEGGGPP